MQLTETIKARLDRATHEKLAAYAKKEDLPVSAIARRALKVFLGKNGSQRNPKQKAPK